MALPSTVINGTHYDASSYEIRVDSTPFSPYVKSLTYNDKLTPVFGYGQSSQPLLRTRGVYDPGSVSFELYKFAGNTFEKYLTSLAGGHGFGEVVFSIYVTITEPGFDTIFDQLLSCRVTGSGNEMPATGGSEHATVKYDIMPGLILHNGVAMMKNPR